MTTAFKTIDDLQPKGKRVLVRADINVPIKDGRVTDATRIERTAPTLKQLADKGARVIVMSHLGRPKGGPSPEFSLKPVADALGKAMSRKVAFAEDCIGPKAEAAVAAMKDGDVLVLENVRFHKEEEKNDPAFAQALAKLGDLYVNDAFGTAHRAHASTEALARLLPAAAGRLMQEELEALGRALEKPGRPVAAIVGGAKVSTKMEVLGHLIERVDVLVIGGGMANTFLLADGVAIGKSLCEREMVDQARAIQTKAKAKGCTLVLPVDAVVAFELKEGVDSRAVDLSAVPAETMILDLGPKSAAAINAQLARCRTLIWNGPVGAFEIKPFDAATAAIAKEAAKLTQAGKLLSVAGGGDTVAALASAGVLERFSYVSTAGGAFLEWLEGKTLPGVAALIEAAKR